MLLCGGSLHSRSYPRQSLCATGTWNTSTRNRTLRRCPVCFGSSERLHCRSEAVPCYKSVAMHCIRLLASRVSVFATFSWVTRRIDVPTRSVCASPTTRLWTSFRAHASRSGIVAPVLHKLRQHFSYRRLDCNRDGRAWPRGRIFQKRVHYGDVQRPLRHDIFTCPVIASTWQSGAKDRPEATSTSATNVTSNIGTQLFKIELEGLTTVPKLASREGEQRERARPNATCVLFFRNDGTFCQL